MADDGAAAQSSLQPHPATMFAPPQHTAPWQPASASGLTGAIGGVCACHAQGISPQWWHLCFNIGLLSGCIMAFSTRAPLHNTCLHACSDATTHMAGAVKEMAVLHGGRACIDIRSAHVLGHLPAGPSRI